MKKVAELFDSKLGEHYDLYTMNAKSFVAIVQGVYEKQNMTPWFVQRFNPELQVGQMRHTYSDRITSILRMKEGLEYSLRSDYHSLENYEKEVKEAEEKFYQGTLFTEEQDLVGSMGYELMPFAVSVKGKDLAGDTDSLELLDGFRRIFYMNNVPDQEVLVKVYERLDDAKWASSMIVFNSWKFAKESASLYFFDRGMKLGLYKRYGIDFPTLLYHGHHDYMKSLKKYVGVSPYETLWQNDQFASDIRFIEQVKTHQPIFRLQKKKGDVVFDMATKPYQLPYFLEAIHNLLCRELGAYRRLETKGILNGEGITRKAMVFDDYLEFLEEKDLQKHFIKLSEMSVNGFIDNYLAKHLLDRIRLIVHPSLVAEKQSKKEEKTQLSLDLDEIKI